METRNENQEFLKNYKSSARTHSEISKSKKSSKSQIAKDSLEYLRIKELALKAEDKDNTEKILLLKKLIAEGHYEVDLDELSEKITQELL